MYGLLPSADAIHALVIVVKEASPCVQDDNEIEDNGQKVDD